MKGIYKRTEYPTAARSAREELGPPPQERIDKEMLQGILSAGGLTKQTNRMLGRLIAEEKLWDEAMELARSDEAQVAFRSAWALEWAYTMDAHPIEARFRRFFEDFLRSDNTSVQRIYSKMLCDMVRRGAVATDALQAEELAGKCFDLLTDEKTVLFDTVDKAVFGQFFENIDHALGGRGLDYIVVSHMEPDHAATLELLLQRHPETRVICNDKIRTMIAQFFRGDDFSTRMDIVKAGRAGAKRNG